ncbi:L-threonylcarbamoyladenylate synthase [Methanobacterium alcaliphilum]|uniref:L-threonylcarbamoyladenylate synthase n=1 Tax=Methanobacterium alcaliphilum TaxID=392018 RepID=UPI00200A419D|nr:L-threonylcarbamoyladenylate synthase [Methanobacterium alcaliphilum]MCK9152197.1 L-threonylcarbamoyladenylate synthase [Methanobacterium alcaliphilum]
MKIIKINPEKPDQKDIDYAINVLENGGIVLYPTDTIYGLAVNIFDDDALNKLYDLKKRSKRKPISICVSKLENIFQIAHINDKFKYKIFELLPGPFTIILKRKENISPILTAGGENIGIRIPDNILCQELTKKFPITASSANISGMPVMDNIEKILNQLSSEVDLVLDAGSLTKLEPSTVIDFSLDQPKILRKGAGYLNSLHDMDL